MRQRFCQLSSILLNIVLKILENAINQNKIFLSKKERRKDKRIRKEKIELLIFAEHMIGLAENPTSFKLLELTNEFGKIAGHKVNIQKFIVFPYITTNRK